MFLQFLLATTIHEKREALREWFSQEDINNASDHDIEHEYKFRVAQKGIKFNGRYPYKPGGGGIKHYLTRSAFHHLFPSEDANKFHQAFGFDIFEVEFPEGYDR